MRKRMRDLDKAAEAQGFKTSYLYDWTVANFSTKETEDMARAGRRKAEAPKQALMLMEALTFVSVAARDNGEGAYQKHVLLKDKWALTHDGIISAGHPIQEDFNSAPDKAKLMDALKRAGGSVTIAEHESGRITVKGTTLRVIVPGLPLDDMLVPTPDAPNGPLDDRLKLALERVAVLVTEAAHNVVEASVRLIPNSAQGTNGNALLEAWHGIADLPPQIILPKLFVQALAKQNKAITQGGVGWTQGEFGWYVSSFTVYFEDGAWIKTATYGDAYPDLSPILNVSNNAVAPPENLFEAVEAVASFNDNGWVTFTEGAVKSEKHSDEVGAVYAVPTLNTEKQFVGKNLLKIAPHAKMVDLTSYGDRMLFFGGEEQTPVRGVVVCILEGGQG